MVRRPRLASLALAGWVGVAAIVWATWPFTHAVETFAYRSDAGRYFGVVCYQNHVAAMTSTRTSPFAFGDRDPVPANHRFVHESAVTTPFARIAPTSIWNRLGFYKWDGGLVVLANDELILDEKWLVPSWVAAVPFALPSLVWLAALGRDRRRRANGLCMACGYDLRGTAGRCPECGRAVPALT